MNRDIITISFCILAASGAVLGRIPAEKSAEKAFREGRWHDAAEAYMRVLSEGKDCVQLRTLLATSQLKADLTGEAIDTLEYYCRLNDSPDAGLVRMLADIYYSERMYNQAEECYKQLISNEEASEEDYKRLASVYFDTSRWKQAASIYTELADSNPEDANSCLYLGEAELKMGEIENASESFKMAMQRDTDRAAPALALAGLQIDSGDYAGAAESLREAIARGSGGIERYRSWILCLIRSGQMGKARGALIEVFREFPERSEPNQLLDEYLQELFG